MRQARTSDYFELFVYYRFLHRQCFCAVSRCTSGDVGTKRRRQIDDVKSKDPALGLPFGGLSEVGAWHAVPLLYGRGSLVPLPYGRGSDIHSAIGNALPYGSPLNCFLTGAAREVAVRWVLVLARLRYSIENVNARH